MKPTDADVAPVPLVRPSLPASARRVIEALSPLVTTSRLARIREVVARRTNRVVPVLEQLVDPHNISAILRSADAFGLQRVDVIEGERGFLAAKRVSKGAHRWLDLVRHEDSSACVEELHEAGYGVYVAAMDGVLHPEQLRELGKVALVFGHEHRGASETVRLEADGTFAIPMEGFVESLNVSVAAAVALRAARGDAPGDLSAEERETLVARFLMSSVRDATRIVVEHVSG